MLVRLVFIKASLNAFMEGVYRVVIITVYLRPFIDAGDNARLPGMQVLCSILR
jgi:hypothetical protein